MHVLVSLLIGISGLVVLSVIVVMLDTDRNEWPLDKLFLKRFWATMFSCLGVAAIYLGALGLMFPKVINTPNGVILSALSCAGLIAFCLIKLFQPYFTEMIVE